VPDASSFSPGKRHRPDDPLQRRHSWLLRRIIAKD
jgi:hypothetical protein